MMKALSIKQPWAWLICAGYKDIENRNWSIGRRSRHGPYSSYHQADFTVEMPCRIYVHAGKQFDFDGFNAVCEWVGKGLVRPIDAGKWAELAVYPTLGAIIGEVDITSCVEKSDSPWFVGRYGFTLANPVLYDKPIPCRGQLGFFEPDIPSPLCSGERK